MIVGATGALAVVMTPIVVIAALTDERPVEQPAPQVVVETVTETITEVVTAQAIEAAEIVSERARLNRVKAKLNDRKAELSALAADIDKRARDVDATDTGGQEQVLSAVPEEPDKPQPQTEHTALRRCEGGRSRTRSEGRSRLRPSPRQDGDGVGCES